MTITIARLHEDRERDFVALFSDERGYELSLPRGFRDRRLRVGARLELDELDELREAARAWRLGKRGRSIERQAARAARRPRSGRISELRPGLRESVYVYLDGEFLVTLPALAAAELCVGDELDEAATARLIAVADAARVGELIDRLTAYRPRAMSELRTRLGKRGIAGDALEAALKARLGYGVYADEQFISWFFHARGVNRGKGFYPLLAELRRLGLPDETIRAAEADFARDEALERAVAKASRGIDPADQRSRQKFIGRLVSRGFSYADAKAALDAMGLDADELDGVEE